MLDILGTWFNVGRISQYLVLVTEVLLVKSDKVNERSIVWGSNFISWTIVIFLGEKGLFCFVLFCFFLIEVYWVNRGFYDIREYISFFHSRCLVSSRNTWENIVWRDQTNAAKETRHKWNWQSWYSDTLFMSLLQNPRGLGDFRLKGLFTYWILL